MARLGGHADHLVAGVRHADRELGRDCAHAVQEVQAGGGHSQWKDLCLWWI